MRLSVLVMLVGILSLACASQSAQTGTSTIGGETGGVEEIANRASILYDQSIEQGRTKEDAVQGVVGFLKSQGTVRDAKATGSNSVRVYFKDGNDLLLLLGKNRL
jgi:hypothetical protein